MLRVKYLPQEPIDVRYRRWIGANPHVLDLFISLAEQLYRAGRRRYGAKAIIERIRFEYATRTAGDEFKLDNSFTSRLVRDAVARQPRLADLFEFRELRS